MRATVARLTPTARAISAHVRRSRRSTSIRNTMAGGVVCGLRCGRQLRSASGSPADDRRTHLSTVVPDPAAALQTHGAEQSGETRPRTDGRQEDARGTYRDV